MSLKNNLKEKNLTGNKFNVWAALLKLGVGETGIIKAAQSSSNNVKVQVYNINKQDVFKFKVTEKNCKGHVLVNRIK